MKRIRRFSFGAPIILLFLSGTLARAAPGWVSEAGGLAAPPSPPTAPAVVLLDRTELSVDVRLRVKRRECRVLKILGPKGVDFATFTFNLEPGARLERLRAWTVGASREEESVSSDVVETSIHPEFYTDVRRVSVRAPHPRAGDLVAVELIASETLPFASYIWIPQGPEGLGVGLAELDVELPSGWEAAFRSSEGVTPVATSAPRRRKLTLGPLPALPEEPWAPSTRLVLPRVRMRVTPNDQGSFENWNGVARWYANLSAPAAGASAPVLVANSNVLAPLDRLRVLAREVQHRVGYAAIELGAQRWVPDAAADTWQRRYGDCKDKSILLVSVLEEAGIEAHAVLTCTRDAGRVDPEWPDPLQFNHCIVALAWPEGTVAPEAATVRGPSGRRWTLFDPTDPLTPLGLLPRPIGGAWALIADSAEGLVQLPPMGSDRLRFDIRARLDDDGLLSGTARILAERGAAGWFEAYLGEVHTGRSKDVLAALITQAGRRSEIGEVRWLGTDSLLFTASLEADFNITDASRRAGPLVLIAPLVPLAFRDPPPSDSSRVLPVWLGWPSAIEQHLEIRLPLGRHIAEMPSNAAMGAAGEYRIEAFEKDGALVVDRRFEVRETMLAADRWPEASGLLRAAYRGDTAPWVIR